MRRYHFHCVGGGDAAFDVTGRWVAAVGDLRAAADRVALDLMTRGRHHDWTGWQVDVHDAKGRRVLVRAFTDVRV